jgi:hypothetical protein
VSWICIARREADWLILSRLRADARLRDMPVLVCSDDKQDVAAHADLCLQSGVTVLYKPFRTDDLVAQVQKLTGSPPS